MKLVFSFFCRDVQREMDFYRQLFKWPERTADRSPIYRALETPNSVIGFHAPRAFDLLGLSERAPASDMAPVSAYPTIYVDSPALVDELTADAVRLGGTCVKGPFATYYGQWQCVLSDPEDHVFRLGCDHLPPGVVAPVLTFD